VSGHPAGELPFVRADVEQGAADSLRQLLKDAAAVLLLAQPEDPAEISLRLLDGSTARWGDLMIGPACAGLWW
jgi:hypothetical protein